MIGQPLPQLQTIQDWNDFVNEMRFWMNEMNNTIGRLQAESVVTPEYVDLKIETALKQAKTYTDNAVK